MTRRSKSRIEPVSIWFCETCQRDYETKESFCKHLEEHMVPCPPDIERIMREKREEATE